MVTARLNGSRTKLFKLSLTYIFKFQFASFRKSKTTHAFSMKVEKTNIIYSLVLSLFILSQPNLLAQATGEGLRFTPSMNIENVLDIASSPSHLYVLS